jgi:hypothetical protein
LKVRLGSKWEKLATSIYFDVQHEAGVNSPGRRWH